MFSAPGSHTVSFCGISYIDECVCVCVCQGSAVLSSLCGVEWRNQDQEQIQNVFKRFLFHYSKAHNSVGSVERESHSVHPLMRLSPKLSLRRKKQQVCASDFLLFLLSISGLKV
uniref:Neuromedin-S n=1 Tax=Cyprinus carpio TaxID=7962 RepID=A0A8C1MH12_CYPCA